jgi:opacity protein-like surface antigen
VFRKISMGIVYGILILLPLAANSQTNVYLGPHLGIQKSHDAQDAIEGDIGYRQEKYASGAVTVKNWPVTVTGLIYPLPIIYGGIGAGWYNTTIDYAKIYNQAGFSDETTQKFGWHLAAGIELPASPNVRLFGDIRYVFIDYEFKNLPGAVLDGVKSDFYSINAGILFRL